MKKLINEKDEPLLKAFIERESKDFNGDKGKGKEWEEELYKKVIKELNKLKGKYERIHISSYGNAGSLSRKLSFDSQRWDMNHKEISIKLCTCGSLNHWGVIEIIDGRVERISKKYNISQSYAKKLIRQSKEKYEFRIKEWINKKFEIGKVEE